MASITDASVRFLRSLGATHRHRIQSGQRFLWALWTATAVALTALSCGDLDPTGQDLDVSASLSSLPGRVDDLRVVAVSDTSVTLVWTEVDDGLGSAPDYQVRYAASPIGWGWGSATVVSRGTCASPIDGVAVDSTLTCTVQGLDASSTYDFQMVAFRGTLDDGAVFGDLSNVATGTTDAPPGPPGQVTDLTVAAIEATSATLRFTQVDDGAGEPASYEVRYAASPIGWGWGSATVVAQGSCASPVAGTAIDSVLTCTVEGLESEKTYDFQAVAFRGTLGVDVVFGELSNVATGTTAAAAGAPGQVTDLAVAAVSDTSATLRFTEVDDGSGQPANYDVRYAASPIGYGWGSATVVTEGTCATPVSGAAVDSVLTCTVAGLAASTDYDFQLVAFRGELGVDAKFGELSNVASGTTAPPPPSSPPPSTDTGGDCANPAPEWIWCDDFEKDRLASYFEYDDAGGSFTRAAGVGLDGSQGMRARWATGQVEAGFLHLAFGRTPQAYFDPVDAGTAEYREIYWRMYVRNAPDWTGGGGDKLSRATIFASSTSWAQAMVAHVWSGSSPDENYLLIDPASGTDEAGNLQTTEYNDPNKRWLGAARGITPIFDAAHVGEWYCVEARARLNSADAADGIFQLWIDGQLDAERTGLNWVGSYDDYGINAVFVENYWNAGSPKGQERYIDEFVVSTQPIGCGDAPAAPAPVSNVTVSPSTVDLEVSAATQLVATLTDADGNTLSDRTVTWTSSDAAVASVDDSGRVTGLAAGSASVTATSEGVSGSATVTVVQDSTRAISSEPAGLGRIAEHDLACVPGTLGCLGLAGEWSLIRGLDNLSVVNTLTSAVLDEPVLQIRFPAGMSDGGEPMRFDGWGPTIDWGQANQYREIYVSFWLKIRGTDYQNQTVGTKILYVSYGSSQRQNHSFFMLQGNGTQSTMTAMPLSYYMSEMRDDGSDPGGGAVSQGANVNDVRFTVGEWHHVELWLKINDINPTVANGEVKWWLDGTLLAHHTGKRFRSDLNPKGLYHLQVTPVYGGNSGDVRTRDDFWLMDDLYISAVPFD